MHQKKYAHITDQDLLHRFYNDGNNEWLGILLERYTYLLLGVCMKYLKNEEAARDAVQQVFMKALTELAKYKVDYIKSWLYTIAKNHCLMQLRHAGTVEINDQVTASLPDSVIDSETLLHKEIQLSLLEGALDSLGTEQKTCVTLFYLQEKTYQQISDTTGFTLLQVKSHIQNGKRNLRLLIEKKMHQTE